MSILSKVVGAVTPAKEVMDVVGTVADKIERYVPSEASKQEAALAVQAAADAAVANARQYDPRSTATGKAAELINVIVDGLNRLVRPVITITLFGAVVGWWSLPVAGTIDPWIEKVCELTLTFWFGSRTVVKDLPAAIGAVKKALRK